MKRNHKLNSRELAQEQIQEKLTQGQPLEFASAEDMLRYDARNASVPQGVEERLRQSVGPLRPASPWWRRLLGR